MNSPRLTLTLPVAFQEPGERTYRTTVWGACLLGYLFLSTAAVHGRTGDARMVPGRNTGSDRGVEPQPPLYIPSGVSCRSRSSVRQASVAAPGILHQH